MTEDAEAARLRDRVDDLEARLERNRSALRALQEQVKKLKALNELYRLRLDCEEETLP